MRKLFYVDRGMCGGDALPDDFDLEEFCEVLQGKVPADVEILPVTEPEAKAVNRCAGLVSESIFLEALGEYSHR